MEGAPTSKRKQRLGASRPRHRTVRKKASPLRFVLICLGLVGVGLLALKVAGVTVFPDERLTWASQARRMKACNDRLESLADSAPVGARNVFYGHSPLEEQPEEIVAWVEAVTDQMRKVQEIGFDVQKTEYRLDAARLDLNREAVRFWRVLTKLFPAIDWKQVRRDAQLRSLLNR